MLFVKDQTGNYQQAPDEVVLNAALQVSKSHLQSGIFIKSPDNAKDAIAAQLCGRTQEVFGCLFLDSQHRILKWTIMFFGTVNRNVVYPREIIKEALRYNAAAVVIAHNHPSGGITPSSDDIHLTKELVKILNLVDVKVLDHLIVGDEIASFKELGFI